MTTDPHSHKRQVADLFDLLAAGYDSPSQRWFAQCAQRLIERLGPAQGAAVLDAATGTGAAATAAARAVGDQGHVHGIDLSEAMLARARLKAQRMSLTNVALHVMDAEHLGFRDSDFDHVVCGFGLFFIPDMDAALRQWFRVLKPGGRLAFSSFAQSAFTPLRELFAEDLAAFTEPPGEPGWYRLSDPAAARALLETAGFEAIEIVEEQHGYHLPDAETWWEILCNTGFRVYLDPLTPEQLAAFRARHLGRVAELATGEGLWLDIATLFTTARRPVP